MRTNSPEQVPDPMTFPGRPNRSWLLPLSRAGYLAGALLVAAVLAASPRWIYGEPSAFVHVRWDVSVDDATRQRLEGELRLDAPQWEEGTTWSYYLLDVTPDAVRRLVRHPAVADTHHLDRSQFTISPDTSRAFRVGPAATWLPQALRSLPLVVILGALLAVLRDLAGAPARRVTSALYRFTLRAVPPAVAVLRHTIGPWTTLFFTVLAAASIRILETDPALWAFLIREDGPVEDATSLALAMASIAFAVAAYRRRRTRYARPFCAVFSILLLAAALEEISWGQRIVGFDSPEFFRQHNAQQETNIHNTLQTLVPFTCPVCLDGVLLTKHVVIAGVAMAGIVLPALLHIPALGRYGLTRYVVFPPLFLSPAIVIGGMFMFDWFDVPSGNEEEAGELLLGVYLLLFGWHAAAARSCCRKMDLAVERSELQEREADGALARTPQRNRNTA